MALDALSKKSVPATEAGSTRASSVPQSKPVKPRPGVQRPCQPPPQESWYKPIDPTWWQRNLRKYDVQELQPQSAKAARGSVKAEVSEPRKVSVKRTPLGTRVVDKPATQPVPAALLMPSPVASPEIARPTSTQPPAEKHESVETVEAVDVAVVAEQPAAKDERGEPEHDEPQVLAKEAGPEQTDAEDAAPVRLHSAASGSQAQEATRPAAKLRRPVRRPAIAVTVPRRGKGLQALKDAIYLPFRVVNFGLALAATVVTLGKAKPLLDYSVDRLGDSLVGLSRTVWNVVRATELPAALGLESERARRAPTAGEGAPAPLAVSARPSATRSDDDPPTPEQHLQQWREATEVPKRTARMTALVINQLGRAVSTSVGLASLVMASVAVTAVMPPLGFVMFALTALGAWTATANLKCAAKNFRRLARGEAALPVGSSATANAWFRAIERKPSFSGPGGRERARTEAAKGARLVTLLNAGVQAGASIASGLAAAPVFLGLFVRKLAPGMSSAVMGWIAETVASRVGSRLRAQAEHDAWEAFDKLIHEVRKGVTPMTVALRAEIEAWGIRSDDLDKFLTHDPDVPDLRPKDPAGKYLTQMTDENFKATLLRTAAVAMINFR